jgi:hypothetical protein
VIAAPCTSTLPVPSPAYQRAQAKTKSVLPVDALTLVSRLHLLALCRLAVRLAQQRCPPPLPAGPGGRPRRYSEESLLLLALLRTLWSLSYQDLHDWLVAWPELALACGLPTDAQDRPCVPSAAQHCRRSAQSGAPIGEMLLVVVVHVALRTHLISGRDLIVDSAPIHAWRRRDPDAAYGTATPLTTIPARCCWVTASTRCCAAARACRCSSCWLLPTGMMLSSPGRCWRWG